MCSEEFNKKFELLFKGIEINYKNQFRKLILIMQFFNNIIWNKINNIIKVYFLPVSGNE